MEKISHKSIIDNIRIDKMLSDVTELSRVRIKELIKKDLIKVNDHSVKPNYMVKIDDNITIEIPDTVEYNLDPIDMKLDIVFEDEDVIVVNKPSGLIVHPSTTSKEPTLVNGLLYHIKDLSGINGILRPGIVHRIDKDTSGLLMVAKNDKAHNSLAKQLKDKTTTRKYLALVYGNIEHNKGRINAPIGRDPKNRIRMGVIENGKEAVTHFTVIKRFTDFSLIECILETGRTHQIRVHMKYIDHPIVGDPVYGPKKVIGSYGQLLHASTLGFKHPRTKEFISFNVKIPIHFKTFLESLK